MGCEANESTTPELSSQDAEQAAARGLAHFKQFQCGSCHSTDWGEVPEQSCTACHNRIDDVAMGRRELKHQPTLQRYTAEQIDHAHEVIVHLRKVPQLNGVGQLYTQEWLEQYLVRPHDVRPRLEETMPRLKLTVEQARDIIAYMAVALDNPLPDPRWKQPAAIAFDQPIDGMAAGSVEQGAQHYEDMGCGSCHVFTGVTEATAERGNLNVRYGVLLAPDLAVTQQRFRRDRLVAYLLSPQQHRPGASMPEFPLTLAQARDLAAFIMNAKPAATPPQPPATFLPLLKRPVGYAEVANKVFNRICVHCHGPTSGDRLADGPGNSGGFGFLPRQLDLSSYEGVRAGVMYEGARTSIVRPGKDGEAALLVRVLKARHHEERAPGDAALPELRGMPLALPALPLEDIQLLESWVAAGAPKRPRRATR